jgi:tRNA modification GTPase
MYKEDTIAAIATPAGEGGVGIVRMSGPDAEGIAQAIFCRSGGKNGKLKSHTLYHGTIRDPKSSKIVDEVLLTIMRKPRSYTGEDVVEVHCHGGVFVVRRALELVLSQGARHAEPGEFTKRAFLNGRLDLAQAEAVRDLILARTEKAAELALSQIKGALSDWVGDLREELIDIVVQVEAAIDFPDEEVELLEPPLLISKIEALREKISTITGTYEWGKLFREGAKVCICGRPNVGKSSLLNALLGEPRVIVTPLPGTTRDIIEESINLDGLPVVLWDTAGIRTTGDEAEQIGVALSLQHIAKSEAVMVVLDASVSLSAEDHVFLSFIKSKRSLIVLNKHDLEQQIDIEQLDRLVGNQKFVSVSATRGDGLQELKQSLRELILHVDVEPGLVLTNLRHKSALVRGNQALADAVSALSQKRSAELIAVTLQEARQCLEEVIGSVQDEDILERIFTEFCIGK